MTGDQLAGLFALTVALTVAGTLVIRVVARRLERGLVDDIAHQVAVRGSAYVKVDRVLTADQAERLKAKIIDALEVHPQIYTAPPKVSVQPLLAWLLVAFVAGAAAAFLAQRVVAAVGA